MTSVSKEIFERYKNKEFNEIFSGVEVVSNKLGEFLKIKNPFGSNIDSNLIKNEELKLFQDILNYRIDLIPGIGNKFSSELRDKNVTQLKHLIGKHPRKYCEANSLISAISNKDFMQLKNMGTLKEEELIFCVESEEILFIDIETTGLNAGIAEVFMIGIGYLKNSKFVTEILIAREISEEAAVLKYFIDLLPRFKLFVSYNGKQFDLPFIKNRIGYLFEPEDLSFVKNIFVDRNVDRLAEDNDFKWPLRIVDFVYSNLIHFDLYYAIRRTYNTFLANFKLTSAEEAILDFQRKDDLPSSEIPDLYKNWINDKSQYMGGMFKIIEHNYYDVVNMGFLLKEWIISYIEDTISIIKDEKSEIRIHNIEKNTDDDKISRISDFMMKYSKNNRRKPTTIDTFLIPNDSS